MSDARETLANARVAHVSLRGLVGSERFVDGQLRRVTCPVVNLHRAPGNPMLERQLQMGEPFLELEQVDGKSFGRAELSGYVGYVSGDVLGDWQSPTHEVCVRQTLAFCEPDLKTPDPIALGLGARVTVTGEMGTFAKISENRFIPAAHLRTLDRPETDPVTIAERMLGVPYLWGGNSAFGIDCSGLVQIARRACGLPCPGDSDQQQVALGSSLPDGAQARRGDLIFWKGHVAWVCGPDMVVHANAHDMAVAREPLAQALARIEALGEGKPTAHIRPVDQAFSGETEPSTDAAGDT